MSKKNSFFLFFFSFLVVFGQSENQKLNIEEFLAIVKKYHPVVKQANINIEKSKAEITIARGAFNPIIANYLGNKKIDNVNYYQYINPTVTIPTWFGVEVSAGLMDLNGNRLDVSSTQGQSSYVGISLPLGKNLLMDKRRANLKQSLIFKDMQTTEQRILVNNILMEAATQYWEWVNAYESYKIAEKNFEVSKQRFGLIKKTFENGERPAIDTIEAKTQFQSFELLKNELLLKTTNERLLLSTFLWQENNFPYQLPENIIPYEGWENTNELTKPDVNELVETAKKSHPELEIYNQKLDMLQIQKRLKFQELLPKADVFYNHINGKNYDLLQANGLFFDNNYQYGLKFEMPIFLSNGRGEFKSAKLKIKETQVLQSEKTLAIEVKIKQYFNEFLVLKNQIVLQQQMLEGFEKLLKAEETLFSNGESSLFLINSRENKFLENKRKLIELKTKYFKSIYALQWSAGLLQ